MKTSIIGGAAALVGIIGGTVAGGLRVKTEIMEAVADSLEAHAAAEEAAHAAAQVEDDTAGAHAEPPGGEGHDSPEAVDGPGSSSDDHDAPEPVVDPSDQAGSPVDFADRDAGQAEGADVRGGPSAVGGSSRGTDMGLAAMLQADSLDQAAIEEGARKLSKIFGAMNPQDAANVLQRLGDEEIELILQQMTDRVAAPILEVFDPDRAAVLSRMVITPGRPRP